SVIFFVFQAEDGIRAGHVTGVQRVLFRSALRHQLLLSSTYSRLARRVSRAGVAGSTSSASSARAHRLWARSCAYSRPPHSVTAEIGRASCRERGWHSVWVGPIRVTWGVWS